MRFHARPEADGESGCLFCCGLSGLYGVFVVSSAIVAAVVDLLVTEEADMVANEWSKEGCMWWALVGM